MDLVPAKILKLLNILAISILELFGNNQSKKDTILTFAIYNMFKMMYQT